MSSNELIKVICVENELQAETNEILNIVEAEIEEIEESNNIINNEIKESFIEEIVLKENDLLSRYTTKSTTFMKEKLKTIEEKNLSQMGVNLLGVKRLSKLEQEKQSLNEQYKLIKREEKNESNISLGDCLIKKKSKLELEKEAFQNLLKRETEELNKLKKENILKLDLDEQKENKINENNVDLNFKECGLCLVKGPVFKGKEFNCKHWYHSKCILNLKF